MKKHGIFKLSAIIGGGLLLIIIILSITAVFLVRKPWPETNGVLKVAGLQAQVKILRDETGVPNIYALNEHDLFFAQGYVHAQDRLWQMEFFRRFGSGRLSEILGQGALDFDKQARYFGIRRIAEESWPEIDPDTRVMMEDYCKGVNTYVETHHDRLPLEFSMIGVKFEPWTPVDTIAWGTLMAYFTQRFNHDYEIFRARAVADLGEEAANTLLPPYAENTPLVVPKEVGNYKWLRGVSMYYPKDEKNLIGDLTFMGSGAWVVDGKHSETGKPIIANDPHLPTWLPSSWYENGLHGGRYDTVGFTLPGVPWVMLGHNKNIGWGFANMNPDVEDFYIEKLDDPKHPKQYEYKGKWHDLKVIHETINVKKDKPVELEIYVTNHGVIMNDLFKMPESVQPLALSWALKDGRQVTRAIGMYSRANNWKEFRTALKYWEAIGQTFLYADVEGNIGLQTAGIIPIRVPKDLGIEPEPGWTGEYDWKGYIPFEEMPSAYNPDCGYLFSANSRVAPDDYPYLISYDWFSPGYRAQRMKQLLDEHIATKKTFSLKDMRDMQADTFSIPATLLTPYLLSLKPANEEEAKIVKYLQSWDFKFGVDSIGATIFDSWSSFLMDDTFNDELDKLGMNGEVGFPWLKRMVTIIELMKDPHNIWFDDIKTAKRENRDDIVRRSFSDTLTWLEKHYGKDPAQWKWGRVHTVQFAHQPMNQAGGILRNFFSSKVYPLPGSNYSINLAYCSRGENGFDVWASASMRMILDVNNWDGMLAIGVTGQCAHLFHKNRMDQLDKWLKVDYYTSPFTDSAVKSNAKKTLELKP
jgi:penicillin amidase